MKIHYYAAPLLAALIWSGNTVVSKLSAGVLDPAAIAFYRWLLAGLLLLPFLWRQVWAERVMIARYWPKLAVLGLLGMVMYQGLAYLAAQSTSASNMGLLLSLIPLFVVALSALWLKEAVRYGDVLGGMVSIAGLAILLSNGEFSRLLSQGLHAGDLLMVAAALAYAAYSVLLKHWQLPVSRWPALFMQIWSAIGFLLLYYLASGAPPVSLPGLPMVLYAGIFASLIAPMLWIHGIHHLGPARTTVMMNLVPVFTVLIAVLCLGDVLSRAALLGGSLVLAGVLLCHYWTRPLQRATARGLQDCPEADQ